MQDVFHSLYRRNAWGDPESVSGPGSGLNRTASFRDQIPVLLKELRAKSLLDAGCGDFNWMRMVDLKLEHYIGVDIVPELIAQNEEMFGDGVRSFLHSDVTRDELPSVDVVLCRDCLVHFSFADIRAAIRNFKGSDSRYLLSTTYVQLPENADVQTGGWRRINLELPPFNFPPPAAMIDEECPRPGSTDKRLALWQLAGIAA